MQQSEIIISSNLPTADVTLAAVGKRYYETIVSLNKIGIGSFGITCSSNLPDYLKYHADLHLFHFSKKTLFFDNGIKTGELEKFFDLRQIGEKLGEAYPDDCLLNVVRIGNNLICNEKSISNDILNAAYENNLNIINVKQGYTKCSVCIVNEECIITDDKSIYKSAQNYFNEVLFISKGSIRLEGKNYGFIGGATGKIGKNKLAFNGRIESHDEHNKIIDLLDRYDIEPVELINDRLTDIGSIIPLMQKKQEL